VRRIRKNFIYICIKRNIKKNIITWQYLKSTSTPTHLPRLHTCARLGWRVTTKNTDCEIETKKMTNTPIVGKKNDSIKFTTY
jgi:hypothetical protein